tara:strand:- start:1446 stop:1652 length:207 start_codon:yes stop_codon:yes gene_type:complete
MADVPDKGGVNVLTPFTLSDYQAAYALYRHRYIRAVVWLQDLAEMTEKESRYSELNEKLMEALRSLQD